MHPVDAGSVKQFFTVVMSVSRELQVVLVQAFITLVIRLELPLQQNIIQTLAEVGEMLKLIFFFSA